MNANTLSSVGGRPTEAGGSTEGANLSCSASREQLPGQGEPNSAVVRVPPVDAVAPSNLRPPTAQTFAELEIPDSFRLAVEKELTGDEKMLWLGRPSRNPQVHPRNPMLPVMGGGLILLSVILVGFMLVSSAGGQPAKQGGGQLFGYVFAGALGVIGLVFLLPLLVNPAKSCRYCYVVTNRRALLVEPSVWQRAPVARSYLPQQLLGLERRGHATVPGAGDLILGYEFVLPGNTLNLNTGSFLQQNSIGGLSNSPQRVPRGFMCLDQVREVEDLIRTRLLLPLEQALDTPQPAASNRDDRQRPAQAASVVCVCGATIEAPPALPGKLVHCPRCAAAVPMAPRQADAGADAPISCRADGSIPADLQDKALAGLEPKEMPVWIGQPLPKLVLVRGSGYLAVGGVGVLIALLWLAVTLMPPPKVAPPRFQPGKRMVVPPATPKRGNPLLPIGLFFVSVGVSAVTLVRWKLARRTCYVLTNRRALVYKESLFGPTRESYSPLEVSGMRRSGSWLVADSGDLIFRTVQVVTRTQIRPGLWNNGIKTIHYGFLAIAQLGQVDKLVRETLIDRFADRLHQASAL